MAKTVLEEALDEHYANEIQLAETIRPLLEPAVARADLRDAATISLAISMKRIADFICGSEDKMDVIAYLGREMEDVAKR